ncbi:putative membrane protein [Metabacillus crassostreae]|uniref:hypothetical protein n=1 Tax=Metabacillus crassostreae TaxID=929098 RepID=UPI00195A5199|nr:hypothetical protein [Metabacillus crassostreae]MBM7602649.1 putative membrane protein [Metabacillus crassostreae]
MNGSRKKAQHLQARIKRDVANRNRIRIIYGFLIVMGIFVLLGVSFAFLRTFYATDLYQTFIYDWIGTAFLFLGGLTLLLFIIYFSLVITLKNPQKISRNKVFVWGGTGIICLISGVFIFQELSSLTINSVRDMKDYSNGVMKRDDLKVVDVYTGSSSKITLINTEEQELYLLERVFNIEEGKTYSFTYLERTGNILNVEMK